MDLRFRSSMGPNPFPPGLSDIGGVAVPGGAITGFRVLVDGLGLELGLFVLAFDVGTTLVPVISPGELWPDESICIRLISSFKSSSILLILCAIRCISKRTSTFISSTVAIKSRCASVDGCSRRPVSYVSDVVALD